MILEPKGLGTGAAITAAHHHVGPQAQWPLLMETAEILLHLPIYLDMINVQQMRADHGMEA